MNDVYLKKCEDYSYDNVKKSIDKAFEDMGGLEKYIKPNSNVLIKPNLLMKKRPQDATTTHPMVIKVVCEYLSAMGCNIIIADSPGGTYTKSSLKGVYKFCEIEDIANDKNISLNYDTSEIRVNHENGKLIKYLSVIKPIEDVDHVISICKLKTHVMATFTGGVKNLFGVIPGLLKAEYHFKMPDIKNFSELLVDICEYVKPTLTIMDGVVGMQGDGPSAGEPRKIGTLLFSANPYAIDVIACKIINLNPLKVPTIARSVERNLLKEDFSDIIVKGDKLEDFIIKDFKLPKNRSINFLEGIIPSFLEKRLNALFNPKPVFNYNICIGCSECKKVCPPDAIEMKDNKPIVDLDKCIRCFCCHELCPKKAVDVKKNFLFKHFR